MLVTGDIKQKLWRSLDAIKCIQFSISIEYKLHVVLDLLIRFHLAYFKMFILFKKLSNYCKILKCVSDFLPSYVPGISPYHTRTSSHNYLYPPCFRLFMVILTSSLYSLGTGCHLQNLFITYSSGISSRGKCHSHADSFGPCQVYDLTQVGHMACLQLAKHIPGKHGRHLIGHPEKGNDGTWVCTYPIICQGRCQKLPEGGKSLVLRGGIEHFNYLQGAF